MTTEEIFRGLVIGLLTSIAISLSILWPIACDIATHVGHGAAG